MAPNIGNILHGNPFELRVCLPCRIENHTSVGWHIDRNTPLAGRQIVDKVALGRIPCSALAAQLS